MDSMTAEKAQWLHSQMFLVENSFNKLMEKSCHKKNIQEIELKKFQSLYDSINKTLDTYQRCKVGTLCRNFNELSILYSDVFRSSSIDTNSKFQIQHQIIPIFSIVDQEINLQC